MKLYQWATACMVALALGIALIAGCGGGGGGGSTSTGGSTGTGASTGSTGGSTGGGTTAATASVATTNDASAPMGFAFASPVTVKSGTSVTWNNQSSAPHSIIWDSQTPSSSPAPGADIGTFAAGAKSAAWTAPTVTAQTTYNYHCGIHGTTMAGQIIVTP